MILPIYAYGQPVLKKVAKSIDRHYENLPVLIENMWETMYNARGVGLAAPQIGLSIRLFVVDTIQLEDEGDEDEDIEVGVKKVFINAEILELDGDQWAYEEGCLSIPHIRGDVERQDKIKIKYLDEHFVAHIDVYEGINARVIQHEYDHIEGILFTELLNPMRRRRIMRKLDNIKKGNVETEYRLKFK